MLEDVVTALPAVAATTASAAGRANAVISVAYDEISVGKHRVGAVVDVHLDGPLLQAWHRLHEVEVKRLNNPMAGHARLHRQGALSKGGPRGSAQYFRAHPRPLRSSWHGRSSS